ncbi:hypothetical protein ES704_01957 [subsurface metagenome]|jgi:hypothetical protein
MEVGDRVTNRFTKQTGIIIDIWDGKYSVDYYEGEQYNPYRVRVKLDNSTGGAVEESIVNQKIEHLEPGPASPEQKGD